MGIDLGEVKQLIQVVPLLNKEYIISSQGLGKMFLTKKWSQIPLACAPHAIVQDLGIQAPEMDDCKDIEKVFTQDSTVFMLNNTYYGSQGVVLEPTLKNGRLKSKLNWFINIFFYIDCSLMFEFS